MKLYDEIEVKMNWGKRKIHLCKWGFGVWKRVRHRFLIQVLLHLKLQRLCAKLEDSFSSIWFSLFLPFFSQCSNILDSVCWFFLTLENLEVVITFFNWKMYILCQIFFFSFLQKYFFFFLLILKTLTSFRHREYN